MNYFGGFEYSLWEQVFLWGSFFMPIIALGVAALLYKKNKGDYENRHLLIIATLIAAWGVFQVVEYWDYYTNFFG